MKVAVKRLQQISERHARATKNGNYKHYVHPNGLTIDEYDESGGTIAECSRWEVAQFFGHASDDIEFLLTLVEQLAVQRRPISRKLRYDLLRRAGFRCQTCGASAQEDGARLEIDHIRPVSRGGTNDPSNLRVLCRDCNGGKGAGPA